MSVLRYQCTACNQGWKDIINQDKMPPCEASFDIRAITSWKDIINQDKMPPCEASFDIRAITSWKDIINQDKMPPQERNEFQLKFSIMSVEARREPWGPLDC